MKIWSFLCPVVSNFFMEHFEWLAFDPASEYEPVMWLRCMWYVHDMATWAAKITEIWWLSQKMASISVSQVEAVVILVIVLSVVRFIKHYSAYTIPSIIYTTEWNKLNFSKFQDLAAEAFGIRHRVFLECARRQR